MSSYPPPSPMQYYSSMPDPGVGDPRSAARRASVLMFVLAGLSLACGGMFAVMGKLITPEMIASSPEAPRIQDVCTKLGLSVQTMLYVAAVMVVLPGILYFALAIAVRGGGRVGVILSMVFNALMLLLMMVELLGGALQGSVVSALCLFLLPLALTIFALTSLVEANRRVSAVAAYRQQYQMQMAQYQQQRQMYGQPPQQSPYGGAGYGYGYGAPQGTSLNAPPQYAPPPNAPGIPPAAEPNGSTVRHPPLPPDPPAPPMA